jgi:hypothetical protein
MPLPPAFFIPGFPADEFETRYAALAEACHSAVPDPAERIYSITFGDDGDEWTATVGLPLAGVHRRTGRVGDPATVLAIFPGTPFMVVTDYGVRDGVQSAFVNPFMAGQPTSVTYFTPERA